MITRMKKASGSEIVKVHSKGVAYKKKSLQLAMNA